MSARIIVCGGDVNADLASIQYFHDNLLTTDAYHEGRWLGEVLFTTFPGGDWKYFETQQPEMNKIADAYKIWYDANPPGSTEPDPPPPPPSDECRGEPRTQYKREYLRVHDDASWEQYVEIGKKAFANKNTLGFSVDDAMIGDLDSRLMVEYGNQYGQQALNDFRDEYYPGVNIQYEPLPLSDGEIEIIDIVDELPKHETKTYAHRDLTDITTLTIHHTVSPVDRSIESIASYHVNSKDWPGIGYGYVIDGDGTIFQTNYLTTISYHAGTLNAPGDENLFSVGIALQGNFTNDPPPQAQLDAARSLVRYLKTKLGTLDVLKHMDMPGAQTACPGATWPSWFPYIAA